MTIEDRIPDRFKRVAYHPSLYVYAWKRKDLEKLMDEVMMWNIAVKTFEVWLIDEDKVVSTIPLKNGDLDVFDGQFDKRDDEQWPDFAERSCKESLGLINGFDLEKNVSPQIADKLYYHFTFIEQ